LKNESFSQRRRPAGFFVMTEFRKTAGVRRALWFLLESGSGILEMGSEI
jgi:hypothetical protein